MEPIATLLITVILKAALPFDQLHGQSLQLPLKNDKGKEKALPPLPRSISAHLSITP